MWKPWKNQLVNRSTSTSSKQHRCGQRRRLQAETLEKRNLLAGNIFHNDLMPEDVNDDGRVSSMDALAIVNRLNQAESRQGRVGDSGSGRPEQQRAAMTDVNDDGESTPLDALQVLNRLRNDQTTNQPSVDRGGEATESSTDVVLQWNDRFTDVAKATTSNQNPGYASRAMAMLNIAIYDALSLASNGSSETYFDYSAILNPSSSNLRPDVVASHAAQTVLQSLYPDGSDILNGSMDEMFEAHSRDPRFEASRSLGEMIGNEVLAARANDGSDAETVYNHESGAGTFQTDPLNPDISVWGPAWGSVDPFAISAVEDFRPVTTPDLTSEQYAASYAEVKELGSVDSVVRTADQTEAGIFWAYDREGMGTPLTLYNQVLKNIAEQEGNTLHENAALFAQASIAMADAGIVAWNTKFEEEFWRPVTAIRAGDTDGNPDTVPDADWTALGAPDGGEDLVGFTPQFPTYISGHATFGGALFGTLQNFYGTDEIAFDLTSRELEMLMEDPEKQTAYGLDLDDAQRSFSSLSEAMAENGRSRVYLGIHFDFDDLVGQEVGQAIADSVADNFSELDLGDAPDRRQPFGNGDVVNQISPDLQRNQQDDTVRRNADQESQFQGQQTPTRPMIRIQEPAIAVDLQDVAADSQDDDRQRRGRGRPGNQGGLDSNLVDAIYRNDSDFLS
ncbi:MAG: chloroperoxidase [Rhodopirellula sp.]|nr:chloroperoxidase [Rhodopirellula sp.]OUX49609.1 MAG: hypothetical protein CBE43_09710 [Rhodopirellula sp. TMED283]